MVLQNKYKARASRRYKATHNIDKGKPASGQSKKKPHQKAAPQEEESSDDGHSSEGSEGGSGSNDDKQVDETQRDAQEAAKYSRRQKKSTNAWRYEVPDSQEEDEEEEPEVDLTNLKARIATMDVNEKILFAEEPSDDDDDDGEGVFYNEAPKKKILALPAEEVEQMRNEIKSAETVRAPHAQSAVHTPARAPIQPPEFDDFDDFLNSIDGENTQKSSASTPFPRPAAKTTSLPAPSLAQDTATMQSMLDDLID
ncbi:hypothetical protein MCUN1_000510 [Malassezia cuniculi]|uniref:Uncharacterized protein n=1 Tax=Malassezia cuniculi TaxID=948313 RepID=A0AAF0EVI1_9BASI|nr:hypothetical protein MCUN1_000510 [Malassezia cuniculi]